VGAHRIADLVVNVADLLAHPGSRRQVELEALLDGLSVSASAVPAGEPVTVDADLQAVNEGIVVKGHVRAPWAGECRRCLQAATGTVDAEVHEVYERHPVDGETRLLEDVIVDLTELARDSVLLELPLAPLCKDDCAGLCPSCGIDKNTTTCDCVTEVKDERWAALDDLRFED
jgi:uncharacterized protein